MDSAQDGQAMRRPAEPGRDPAVLIVSLSRRFGGAEVRVLQTATALRGKCRHAVAVLEGSPLHRKLSEAGCPVLPFAYGRGDPRLFFALRRAIRSGGFHVVDAHNPQSQLWGLMAAASLHVPAMVSTVHSSYGETDRGVKKVLYEGVLRLDRLFRCRFIAVSEAVREYLLALGIPSRSITLVHNAIPAAGGPVLSVSPVVKESLGWKRDDYLVAAVGRLERVKGHAFLIEALGSVVRERPRLRCLFVGEGRLRAELETLVRERGLDRHVRFAGFREDVIDILRGSDAFCMPSLSEGLPYALLEACSLGLPVLATAVGGIARFIEDGRTGLLVPPADAEALSGGLAALMDDPEGAKAMGTAALGVVRERFSPVRMLAQTLGVYGLIDEQDGRDLGTYHGYS